MPRKSSSLEKPLEGVVICCTSILPEDRTELAEYAQHMGAEHTLDLTSDVTHLIVGDTNSKKYQYVAKEREDVKVLRPDWLRAVRDVWMADQPLDLIALDAKYRVPTLFGLKICITGFEDLAFRNAFALDIEKNGGLYTGDLTKDVTHLIACTAAGKKYEYANIWQIKVVSVNWYRDSLERGMQLDESLYHPMLPPEQQGIGAWYRRNVSSPNLGKRARDEQTKPDTSRKLRRTASTKFGSQHQEIWGDIVGSNGAASKNCEPKEVAINPTNPVLRTFNSDTEVTTAPAQTKPNQERNDSVNGVLHGKHFATKGFDDKRKGLLFTALTGLGAHVYDAVSEMDRQLDLTHNDRFLVVPYNIENKYHKMVEQKSINTMLVTELWVEWCITMKKFVDPDTYVLGRPITPIALPAITKMTINTSGFHQIQTMHISKVVSQLGAQYQEIFTPETSVLVCNSSNVNPQKLVHATAWNIPTVTEKWLEQLVKQERVPSFEHFKVAQMSNPPANSIAATDKLAQRRQVEDSFKGQPITVGIDGCVERQSTVFQVAQDDQTSQQSVPRAETGGRHLQEVSPNIKSRPVVQTKRKLFNTFESALDTENEMTPVLDKNEDIAVIMDGPAEKIPEKIMSVETDRQLGSDHEKQHDLIKEFLEVKAAAAAKLKGMDRRSSTGKLREKRLLGRALSNLSNSSRTSNDNTKDDTAYRRQTLSRASSISSIITDGLGVSLSNISRLPSDPKVMEGCVSRMEGKVPEHPLVESSGLSSFHAQLHMLTNSQPVRAASPPPRSQDQGQLTYADSAEAVKLRAQLAEKRKARAKLGQRTEDPAPNLNTEESEEKRQQEWRERERKLNAGEVLRDDEAVIGGGRRTRGRDRALAGLEAAKAVEDDWWAGVL